MQSAVAIGYSRLERSRQNPKKRGMFRILEICTSNSGKEEFRMRRLISSGSSFEREIGYSRAVVDEDWVFVAGTTGFNYKAMTISDDVVEQTEQCLLNIEAALADAGSQISDVVRVRYIL